MAAGLGFKTFNTGDVLSAADTNGYLMQGVLVFADAAARSAAITSPQEGQTSYLKDTDVIQVYSGSAWVTKSGGSSPLTTKGDLYTYSTTDARLPVGTNGHTLVADSAAATGLKWAAPTGGGKVLQVVQATNATEISIQSTSFTDTNLTGSITPSSASSKILVMVSQNSQVVGDIGNVGGSTRLMRDATTVYSIDANGYNALYSNYATLSAPTSGSIIAMITYSYLDSPATTSSITYKTQSKIFSTANSRAIKHQVESVQSNLILIEIGA